MVHWFKVPKVFRIRSLCYNSSLQNVEHKIIATLFLFLLTVDTFLLVFFICILLFFYLLKSLFYMHKLINFTYCDLYSFLLNDQNKILKQRLFLNEIILLFVSHIRALNNKCLNNYYAFNYLSLKKNK